MILLCMEMKNILMARVSPARPPCKTFHRYSESTLYTIVEVGQWFVYLPFT